MIEPSESKINQWKVRRERFSQATKKIIPVLFGMILVLFVLWIYNTIFDDREQLTLNEVNEAIAQVLASATPPPAYSSQVYQAVRPSLVLIQARNVDQDGEERNSLGSGVVINEMGDILTSLHVVDDATSIQLTFADGSQTEGQVIGMQPENDIAVLAANHIPISVIPAVLGNPNAMRVGDEAFALGNPFGLYSSMTAGVISGFERTFQPPGSEHRLEGLIQIDAAVNPGNSGGPLLNRSGHVIGIVVGIVNPTEQEVFIGIGFAVPIQVAASAAGSPMH
ncbi:MAG: trypsin-like peptidase domain-containing protein [Anaerolineales bacterium]|nr:trypsin-like peptidase domain-containing protein [Anaerolineales bacterium]